MSNVNFQLGDIHRRRAELLGEEGLAWIEDLPALIARLESRWQIQVTSQLSGGTEALVLTATTSTGEPVVLKIGQPGAYKLVDPDGFFMEPAYDLGISLREWIDELNADGNPLSSGKARCELLAGRTGVPDRAIWQWGVIEHVSSGLLYLQLQQPDSAARHLNIANAWLSD